MKSYRINSDADIKTLFQIRLDTFPRTRQFLDFCEFGATLIRPQGEPKERLTHLVFPDAILYITAEKYGLPQFADISDPKARLYLNPTTMTLYIYLEYEFEDKQTRQVQRKYYVFDESEFRLVDDLWDYFHTPQQQRLEKLGFGAHMGLEAWKTQIHSLMNPEPEELIHKGQTILVHRFQFAFLTHGMVGFKHTFVQMPGYTFDVLHENTYRNDDLYEIGNVHIHPDSDGEVTRSVQRIIGVRMSNMTVSPNDVRCARGSINAHNRIREQFNAEPKDTAEGFITIVGVDPKGQVYDIQHCDLGFIDNMDEMGHLNDRTLETFANQANDVNLIAEHYKYFNNPEFSAPNLGGEVGEHVGDTDFEGVTTEHMYNDVELSEEQQSQCFCRLMAESYVQWGRGALDCIDGLYKTEVYRFPFRVLLQSYEIVRKDIETCHAIRNFESNEYLIANDPDKFLMTSQAIYFLQDRTQVLPVTEIQSYKVQEIWKYRLNVRLKSGETLKIKNKGCFPDESIVKLVREGRVGYHGPLHT